MADPVSAQHLVFGETLRDLRHERGLSQEAFAAAAGLDRGYTGRVERGEANLTLKNVWKIADALDVPASEIFARFETRAAADPRTP